MNADQIRKVLRRMTGPVSPQGLGSILMASPSAVLKTLLQMSDVNMDQDGKWFLKDPAPPLLQLPVEKNPFSGLP